MTTALTEDEKRLDDIGARVGRNNQRINENSSRLEQMLKNSSNTCMCIIFAIEIVIFVFLLTAWLYIYFDALDLNNIKIYIV